MKPTLNSAIDVIAMRGRFGAFLPAAFILCVQLAPLGVKAANPIWINPLTCGSPIATYYHGDSLAATWYVNFEIGQGGWDKSQVGYGTNVNGTGFNWADAFWFEDGSYPNKRVRRNIGGLQFTSTGNWYLICQARESAGDNFTSAGGCGWVNNTTFPPPMNNYFTVNALNPPTIQTATKTNTGQMSLTWARGVSGSAKETLILRSTSPITTDPTQGTSYTVSNTIGGATVIYKGNATAFTDTGLTVGTHYHYKFYAENSNYYSTGVSASATANTAPVAQHVTTSASQGTAISLTIIGSTKHSPTDSNGDSLTVTGVGLATSGTAGYTTTSITYNAAGAALGTNTFSYTVSDGFGGTDTKTVSVIVTPGGNGANIISLSGTVPAVTVNFAGLPSSTYGIERASSPTGPWTSQGTVSTGTNGLGSFTDDDAPSPTGYFRTLYISTP